MSLKTFYRDALYRADRIALRPADPLASNPVRVSAAGAKRSVRRTRFRLLHVLVLATLTIATAACGGSGPKDPSEPPGEEPGAIQPGHTYTGRNGYIEYVAGDMPIILTVPHDGTLEPDELADRTNGVTDRDLGTQDLARQIVDVFIEETGHRPHLIINRLHRIKLDANRDIEEAANGDTLTERAWREFHTFIDTASAIVTRTHGRGILFDIHGHGHPIQRLELGYLLYPEDLARSDAELNSPSRIARSSVRTLAATAGESFADLLRGPDSFGALMDERGYDAVPSPAMPDPDDDPYFTGGYITERHGSRAGGSIDAIQIETNYFGIRETNANRRAFAEALVAAVLEFVGEHY